MRKLWTDGSASPNPGPGGFSVIEDNKPVAMGREDLTTNIRMEGSAILEALKVLAGEEAEIWTDSEFWINVLTKWAPGWEKNGWKKKSGPIKNLGLVKKVFKAYREANAKLVWVRGHNGTVENELADEWANKAREKQDFPGLEILTVETSEE